MGRQKSLKLYIRNDYPQYVREIDIRSSMFTLVTQSVTLIYEDFDVKLFLYHPHESIEYIMSVDLQTATTNITGFQLGQL